MDAIGALRVIVKDLLTLTPRLLGIALPRGSYVNQTKIEFLQVRNLLACTLDQMTLFNAA
jgi:hypothetical protein